LWRKGIVPTSSSSTTLASTLSKLSANTEMSSTASNDSLPSTTSSGFSLSPHEMSLIVLDNPSVDLLNETFGGDCTASAHLRHYMFVSQSIRRLESELDRHHAEQRTLFDHILENENFRRDLHPIITLSQRFSSLYPTSTHST